ncbi:MAG: thiamine-phosphate kinase [Pseudomonadota bacterium]
MDEFELIARLFRPLAGEAGLALSDDAALLRPPPGADIVATKDMVAAGVHFLHTDSPEDIAWKALAVNVSDLAAKGADPWVYLLGLGLGGDEDDAWLGRFAEGLHAAQAAFGLSLAGGDTIRAPGRLVLSITALGKVPAGHMIRRAGARPGDGVYVSGALGDAGLGLAILQGALTAPSGQDLIARYRRPQPRLALGQALRGMARAAADISDGLVADLGHICAASEVAADILLERIPLSPAALATGLDPAELRRRAAVAGDDYELVFTVPDAQEAALFTLCQDLSVTLSRVGTVQPGHGVVVRDSQGRAVDLGPGGYRHR